jgi:hypothetical protein
LQAGVPDLRVGQVHLQVAGFLLGAAALALLWSAFSQFDEPVPSPGAPPSAGAAYERAMVEDARRSVALGVSGCVVLLGALACFQWGRQERRSTDADPQA